MEFLKEYMNITDGVVAVVIILGMLGGVRRGLSGELLRFITVIIAFVIGWKFSDQAAAWLDQRSDWPQDDLKGMAFFGLMVAVYLVLGIVRHGFRFFLDFSFKGKLEILGGALLGLVRASLFASVALLGASMIPSEALQTAVKESQSGSFVIEHIGPLYNDLAEKNPEFKLPEVKHPELNGSDTPAIELPAVEDAPSSETPAAETPVDDGEQLGPLITPDEESSNGG